MPHKENYQGTGNVPALLCFDSAQELSMKTVLALKFSELIDRHGLSQIEVAEIDGMTQHNHRVARDQPGCGSEAK